ncbi:MAG: hypothetical protein Q7S56_01120 [Nanoarchaeota archaeon]|nr:hypothetical protein [Nanoarchaeota archaeon]
MATALDYRLSNGFEEHVIDLHPEYAFLKDEEYTRSKFSKREDAEQIVASVLYDYQYSKDSVKSIAEKYKITKYQIEKLTNIAERTGGLDERFVRRKIRNSILSKSSGHDLHNLEDVLELKEAHGFNDSQIEYLRGYTKTKEPVRARSERISKVKGYRTEGYNFEDDFKVLRNEIDIAYDTIQTNMNEDLDKVEIPADPQPNKFYEKYVKPIEERFTLEWQAQLASIDALRDANENDYADKGYIIGEVPRFFSLQNFKWMAEDAWRFIKSPRQYWNEQIPEDPLDKSRYKIKYVPGKEPTWFKVKETFSDLKDILMKPLTIHF